ncbi:PREDICTED: GATA transcription factor 16-like [Erythranthe guttata]|uniref:GATA transcription factor 16-like n=1 Tax=Erythranthe guttata TaxID=4155 RepID=UPI00064D8077|nr:PREDICTED: GATA transcription factor 16-like [Erythranthe guttata]|eukprot:XP_012838149.1 PREDICTED: GATA transcription factor 16-like [Erythranthe guttata]
MANIDDNNNNNNNNMNNEDVIDVDLTLRLGLLPYQENARVDNLAAPNEQPSEQVNRAASPAAPRRHNHIGDEDKVCNACGITNTPVWRKGPDGPKTLCNACGLKHSRSVRRGAQ